MLSDGEIKEMVLTKDMVDNYKDLDLQIQPASIDLRLGNKIMIMEDDCDSSQEIIDPSSEVSYLERDIRKHSSLLNPKSFILATTKEKINLPSGISAFIEGRSSIGRQGLFVENAGWVDPGFEGQITLELFNATNKFWKLRPDMRICQIVFAHTSSEVEVPYNGKYQNQTSTTPGKSFHDKEWS